MSVKRFLLISPYFPPSSRIGAKRALNLARHLPALGWEPIVLCCPEREGAELIGQDGLVPRNVAVHREFTSRLGRLLRGPGDRIESIPKTRAAVPHLPARKPGLLDAVRESDLTPLDMYMWDIPFVIGRATRIAREAGVEAVVVNADPWSGLVVGVAVARRLGLPLIADFRDPWALHPRRQPLRAAVTRRLVSFLERRLLRRVDRLVLNTEKCAAAYRSHYAEQIPGERISFIRNAFDADIYHSSRAPRSDAFDIHYFGTVGSGRNPMDFYVGLAKFVAEHDLGPSDVSLVAHGDAGPAADPRVCELGLHDFVETRPPSLLRDALHDLRSASLLLLLEGSERELQLPAKLYDYLAAERPILAVGAHEELSGILDRTGAGVSTRVGEGPDAVADHLRELYSQRNRAYAVDDKVIDEFRANSQAVRFRNILDELVPRASG